MFGIRTLLSNGIVKSSTPLTLSRTCTCVDFVGRPVVDGTFSSDQHRLGLYLDGNVNNMVVGANNAEYVYNVFPLTPTLTSVNTAHLVEPADWYTTTVARSNPSRPDVTPLTLIQDFIEIPSMLRNIGHLLTRPAKSLNAKELANQNLAYQFGWLPLVNDVKTLLDLQSHVLRRTRELQKLYSGAGLRRRIQLKDDTQKGGYSERVVLSTNSHFDFAYNIDVKRKVWSTIRWRPTTVPPGILQDFSMNKLAKQVVLGLTPEGLTQGAWDLIPWTWMIDWFVNVGEFMLTNSNTVPAEHSSACLMNEVLVTCAPGSKTLGGTSRGTVNLYGSYINTSKRRVVSGSIVPGFKLPYISSFRLSILGSLFVQRFAR